MSAVDVPRVWLAADYHFPSTYSCRVPMSSANSASAMPAPGPATVRLALVHTGIELFGIEYTREVLFPCVRSMNVRIKPPQEVAISSQVLRAYKTHAGKGQLLIESVVYREYAHAGGPMTVYLQVPGDSETDFAALCMAVGYWGQANSFTTCLKVGHEAPQSGEYAVPLQDVPPTQALDSSFTCFATEFTDDQVNWTDIVPGNGSRYRNPLKIEIYVWPLVIRERRGSGILLRWRSLAQSISYGPSTHGGS